MTTAADEANAAPPTDDVDITSPAVADLDLPVAEEMRQARRRVLIEGVLAGAGVLGLLGDDGEAKLVAVVQATDDDMPTLVLELLAELNTDDSVKEAVAADLVRELQTFEDDLRALAAGDVTPEVVDATAAAALETAEQISPCPDCAHEHAGVELAYICIGCPCQRLWGKPETEPCESCGKPSIGRTADEVPVCRECADALVSDQREPSLADAGEVAPDKPEPPPAESHELPLHRVTCMAKGCRAGATYRPTASGSGFMVLERFGMDLETVLGAGPNGRPVCPKDGHGEMTLADEQLPAGEAIAQVADKVARAKKDPKLPFPTPPFNFEGAFEHIIEKRHEVKQLEEKHEDLKGRTKKAKDELDEANEELGEMIDDYEERIDERAFEHERRARQAAEGHPEGTTLVRCVWDQQNPNDPCPFCPTTLTITGRHAIVKLLGAEILPRDANGHADQVVAYRQKLDIRATDEAIADLLFGIPLDTIAGWSTEEREEVRQWAATKGTGDPRPKVLGRPHIAAAVTDGAKVQACVDCGAVIKQLDDTTEPYPYASLVRTDCAGAEPDGHRYPDTSKKPRRSRPAAKEGGRKPDVESQKADTAPARRARGITKPATPPARKPEARPKASTKKPAPKKSGKGRR